jgi:hypothetical protein
MNEISHSVFKRRCTSFAYCDHGVQAMRAIRAIALSKR